MSEGASFTYGFKDFYLDDSIPGHFLIEPSLLVFDTYGRVFSPIEESNTLLEVISRVVLFALATIALVFALILASLGILIKAGAASCMDPEIEEYPQSLSFQAEYIPEVKPLLAERIPPKQPIIIYEFETPEFNPFESPVLSYYNTKKIAEPESEIMGNGDCLFETFAKQLEVKKDQWMLNVHNEAGKF